MTKNQREEIRTARKAFHDTPAENIGKLYDQVYVGLKQAGMTSSALIVQNALADLLAKYTVKT